MNARDCRVVVARLEDASGHQFGRMPINVYFWPRLLGYSVHEEWEGLIGGGSQWRPTVGLALATARRIARRYARSGDYVMVRGVAAARLCSGNNRHALRGRVDTDVSNRRDVLGRPRDFRVVVAQLEDAKVHAARAKNRHTRHLGRLPVEISVWPCLVGYGVSAENGGAPTISGRSWVWRPTVGAALATARRMARRRVGSGDYVYVDTRCHQPGAESSR